MLQARLHLNLRLNTSSVRTLGVVVHPHVECTWRLTAWGGVCVVSGGGYGSSSAVGAPLSTPLSSFVRRLFLQVLLEDERVEVLLASRTPLHRAQLNAMSSCVPHPRAAAGYHHRALHAGMHTTCAQLVQRVLGTHAARRTRPPVENNVSRF